jgi:hypothetical protein
MADSSPVQDRCAALLWSAFIRLTAINWGMDVLVSVL